MSFASDLRRFSAKYDRKADEFFTGATDEVARSVVEGSTITAAPGQPVQTGNLKNSWIPRRLGARRWQITTNVVYAPVIEDLIGIQIRSSVGGGHSVKMTRAGWQLIVDHVARRVGD